LPLNIDRPLLDTSICRGVIGSNRCVQENSRQQQKGRSQGGPMNHKTHNVSAAEKIGRYSDAIEAAPGLRWLHTSGTPGVLDNGTFPEGIEAQTRLA
jgi:enamine deaminase RidA (YjgF/YER057c/UK114 family)